MVCPEIESVTLLMLGVSGSRSWSRTRTRFTMSTPGMPPGDNRIVLNGGRVVPPLGATKPALTGISS